MPFVLIVDSSLLMREGLKQLLTRDYRGLVFGEAQDMAGALTQAAKHEWDLIIVDLNLSNQDGFSLLAKFRKRDSASRVLTMTTRCDQISGLRAYKMGAAGYVGKDAPHDELLKAIQAVFRGKRHFVGVRLPSGGAELAAHKSLSPQEYKILLAFAGGKRVTEIASELSLSAKTVSTYKRRILNKLHLASIADLVRYVVEHELS